MDDEHGHDEGQGDAGNATGDSPGPARAGARPRDSLWRRVLLLIWGGAMIAVVLTGVVGFLVYFFLLQR